MTEMTQKQVVRRELTEDLNYIPRIERATITLHTNGIMKGVRCVDSEIEVLGKNVHIEHCTMVGGGVVHTPTVSNLRKKRS